ncbi:MAG: DUF309 domain-containing protein [Bacteroidota bacterium]
MKLPKKKKIQEIDPKNLSEPDLTDLQSRIFIRGIELFNSRKFWEAHEAWEEVWKLREEESRIFFQGVIQAAAGYHLLLVKRRYGGTINNFDKALSKLGLFPSRFLGIDVGALRKALRESKTIAVRLGAERLGDFPDSGIPTLIQIPQ